MGMVLNCPRDALPGQAAAFLILDYELRVSAVSKAGERFFGKEETLIGCSLLSWLPAARGRRARAQGERRRPAAVRRDGHARAPGQPEPER